MCMDYTNKYINVFAIFLRKINPWQNGRNTNFCL